jgi:DNA-binding IscR family transcriptional regulator
VCLARFLRVSSNIFEGFLLTNVTAGVTYRVAIMRANCRFAMALQVMAVLAYKAGGDVSSALLAASVNTNPVIIRRLLLALQRAKLIETRKGAGCGSRLRRPARRIRLDQVYRAVAGGGSLGWPRRPPSADCPVGRGIAAAVTKLFGSARAAFERELARTTLADFLGETLSAKRSRPARRGASNGAANGRKAILLTLQR